MVCSLLASHFENISAESPSVLKTKNLNNLGPERLVLLF